MSASALGLTAAQASTESALVILTLVIFAVLLGLLIWRRPDVFLRPHLWLITHSLYWLRVYGKEHVPASGAALLVCNHVSYVDWMLLMASQRRRIRFLVWAGWTKHWLLKRFIRWVGAIPIDGSSGPRAIVRSLQAAAEALDRGELVCIFAEGRLTPTGFLLPFHRGFEQILKRSPAPIIPACLDHVWGSIFSYRGGKVFWKRPIELPYPVSLAFGTPLPPTATAAEVRLAIQKLSADCAYYRTGQSRPVHRQFVRMAAGRPFRPCVIDPAMQKEPISYGKVLAGAICLSGQLRKPLHDDEMVGLWMPPSGGGALANIVLAMLGKTSVNLNYSTSPRWSVPRSASARFGTSSRRSDSPSGYNSTPGKGWS